MINLRPFRRLLFSSLLVLVAAFTSIMAAHAITSADGDFEAENVTSGLSRTVYAFSDSAASGGSALLMYTNATVGKTVTTPAVSSIAVTARGTQCSGAPQMTVKVDGVTVLNNQQVAATTYTKYSANLTNVKAGSHSISLAFTNDGGTATGVYGTSSCSRDLYLDKVEFTPSGDKTAPVVLISSPASGAVLKGSVPAQAGATDNVGVKKVEFYLDGALVRTQQYAPYCFAGDTNNVCNQWDTTKVSDGSHTIVAKAYDAANNVGQNAVTVSVSNTVAASTIGAPINDTNASGGKALELWSNGRAKKTTTTPAISALTVTARGNQCDGAPSMTVKLDGNVVLNASVSATSFTAYKASLTNIAAGSHTVAIEFTNDLYQAGLCDRNLIIDKVEFTPAPAAPIDTTKPAVGFTSPANGSTLSGSQPIQAAASDNVGVKKVEFYLDTDPSTNSSAQPLATSSAAPYCLAATTSGSCPGWDTTTVANGTHSITAKAYDAAGNTSQATVSFTVSNITQSSGSLLQMLQYDMACANGVNPGCPTGSTTVSEAMPNGFTGDWAYHPKYRSTLAWRTGEAACGTSACTQVMPWGTLYQQSGGNQTQAKAQISDLQVWGLYDNGQWYKLWSNKGVPSPSQGQLFPEGWTCNGVVYPGGCSANATTGSVADGSSTVYLPQTVLDTSGISHNNFLYHFWSSQRYDLTKGPQPVATLKTVITLARARIDPATYDPNAKYVLTMGMDRWGPNGQNGWEQAVGRFKKIDSSWRVYSSVSGPVNLSSVPGPISGVLSDSEFR